MTQALSQHWPLYAMEAALLGVFLFVACGCAVLLEHPSGPLRRRIACPLLRRSLMGVAMGLTAITLIYSPWGQTSGAHMNPAATLTFFMRGKIQAWDAVFYVVFQALGAAAGVALARGLFRGTVQHASVNHVVTVPGRFGIVAAWVAETLIAFVLMLTVLIVANDAVLTPFTGFFAGALVALYITLEAPVSGMSLNPARSFGSALVARHWRGFWIYLSAPPVGMLLASLAQAAIPGHGRVYCAKLAHCNEKPCIFNCEFSQLRPPAAR